MAESRFGSLDLQGFCYDSLFPENNTTIVKIIQPSGYESLIACKNDEVTLALLASIKNDPLLLPLKPLELPLASLDYSVGLSELWRRGATNTAQHINPQLGFHMAKRFNHPQLAKQYLDFIIKQKGNYALLDNKTLAILHISAYFGMRDKMPQRKVLESDAGKATSFTEALNKPDHRGELPLFSALQGGHKDIFELYFDYTSADYDICMLPLYCLESRNAALAPIFMDKLIAKHDEHPDSLFKKYGSFDNYTEWLFIYAIKYSQNPGLQIITLLLGISDIENRSQWLARFREVALENGYSSIFTALARGFMINDSDAQIEIITEHFIEAVDGPSPKINLPKLVVETYLPYIEEKPARLCEILMDLNDVLADGESTDFDEISFYGKIFLQYVPNTLKQLALKQTTEDDILQLLKNTNNNARLDGDVIVYKLFELSNQSKISDIPLEKFKPLLALLAKSFETNGGMPIMLQCAANLGFLLKDKRVLEWYDACPGNRYEKDGIIVSALKIMAKKLTVIFKEINPALPASFIKTYKNNLFELVDTKLFIFHLPLEALAFVKDLDKKDYSFKNLFDEVYAIDTTLPVLTKKSSPEVWELLYNLKQATLQLLSLLDNLAIKYSPNGILKPDEKAIASARNQFAILRLSLHFAEFYNTTAIKLGIPINELIPTENLITHVDICQNAIEQASSELTANKLAKEKKSLEAKKNQEMNALVSKMQARNKKPASDSKKHTGEHVAPAKKDQSDFTSPSITQTSANLSKSQKSEAELKKLADEMKMKKDIEEALNAEIELEKQAKTAKERAEAERKAAEEKARIESERKIAEEKAKIESERKIAEEKARIEAERKASEEKERIETERKKAEEKAAAEKERLRIEQEKLRILAKTKSKEEAERKISLKSAPSISRQPAPSTDYDIEFRTPGASSSSSSHSIMNEKIAKSSTVEHAYVIHPVPIPVLVMPQQLYDMQQHMTAQQFAHLQQMHAFQLQYQRSLQLQNEQQMLNERKLQFMQMEHAQRQREQQIKYERELEQARQIQQAQQNLLEEQVLYAQKLQLEQQEEFARQLRILIKAQSPQKLSEPKNSVISHAASIGIPLSIGKILEAYEGRIFIAGGANRDYYWNVTPNDYDLVLFGTFAEFKLQFPNVQHIKEPTDNFAAFYIDGHKVDILFKPCKTREENIQTLIEGIDERDFTMNSLYREISAIGSGLICRPESKHKEDAKNFHFDLATELFGANNFTMHPLRLYRFIFLKHKALSLGATPTYSPLLLSNLDEIKNNPDKFIKKFTDKYDGKKLRKNVRRFLDNEIAKDKARAYRVLVEEQQHTTLITAGVFTNDEWRDMEVSASNADTSISKGMDKFGMFGKNNEEALVKANVKELNSPRL